ncbi:unannotated protein [freshwater metagenome]|uniref:Unannotated protein n=1 Tax=freshwater metagenome TaxID=449393 RepID=A0A6J6X494_9ZZZZ
MGKFTPNNITTSHNATVRTTGRDEPTPLPGTPINAAANNNAIPNNANNHAPSNLGNSNCHHPALRCVTPGTTAVPNSEKLIVISVDTDPAAVAGYSNNNT